MRDSKNRILSKCNIINLSLEFLCQYVVGRESSQNIYGARTMKHEMNKLWLSATDLAKFTACPHSIRLDLAYLEGEDLVPTASSGQSVLLQKYGDEHEKNYLKQLESEGRAVVRIEREGVLQAHAVAATREALNSGAEVVFQAALSGGMWHGYADFLERVPAPSALGNYSYEAVDTKLKRKTDPSHVLQLYLYSRLLADIQGRMPEQAHVQLGNGQRANFRLNEYSDYAKQLIARLEQFVGNPSITRPIPCAFCGLCRWREHCADEWQKADSLHLIAGITKNQVAKIETTGIQTMSDLAVCEKKIPKLAEATTDKLKTQAHLQTARKTGSPCYALRPHAKGKGFELLPLPEHGDLFYDIEGDPFYSEEQLSGLEYLHGIWDGADFTALWAHNLEEEKQSLRLLIALFEEQFQNYPQARIYHYAPYEITALRKLVMRHRLGEAKLDRWLRERRFVDLYAVVRGGICVSEPSYSLKNLEVFYEIDREGAVVDAGSSIVAYENWRESGDKQLLAELEKYNRIDCISLEGLRNWLHGICPQRTQPELGQGETANSLKQNVQNQEIMHLLDAANLSQERQQLLYNLGVFHWREQKPQAWSVFDLASKDVEELCDNAECLAGLVAGNSQSETPGQGRNYRYPSQETKLRQGDSALIALEGGFKNVNIAELNHNKGTVALTASSTVEAILPDELDLLPKFALNPGHIPHAIKEVIEDQCGPKLNRAAEDLLSRNPPRFNAQSPLPIKDSDNILEGMIRAIRAMDNTVLPIQGPPGTGKTYAIVRAILALVKDGKRVAVCSNSHAAVINVLTGCARALRTSELGMMDADVIIVHKISSYRTVPNPDPEGVRFVKHHADPELHKAHIVGGTAWLFSNPDLKGFDHLFVDEAGQVALANLVAISNAANNLVLVGDPRQLPQVIQAAHPYPADRSCLDWVLGEGLNVDKTRGIFLPNSFRMHPDLCNYISSQFYENRLTNHPSTALQNVHVDDLPGHGVWRISVAHQGCVQVCHQEIAAICDFIGQLLNGIWTDRNGLKRSIDNNDLIVVAPYNAQVNALAEALPDIRVGTVDKFQGQEAPIVLVSMTASSFHESTRGIDFLLSRERLNVAVSRGQALSLIFASPELLSTHCETIEQMRLVNALCALPEMTAQNAHDGIVVP